MTPVKTLAVAAAAGGIALLAVSDVFGHPHRCKVCGVPGWCTHDDRGQKVACAHCMPVEREPDFVPGMEPW